MDAIEAPAIERLGPAEAAAGLSLSDAAGWNQTLDDWGVFLTLGTVFACRGPAREVIATAALLPYGDITWVGMVLVAEAWRRRGLATALLRHALAEAGRRGLQPWLDATPAGATVYEPLGFRTLDRLTRLRRLSGSAAPTGPAEQGSMDARASLIALDTPAFGRDRSALLGRLADRPGSRVYEEAGSACLVRDGRRARQIGPLLASDEAAALRLIDRVLDAERGPLVIDLFDRAGRLTAHLLDRGFAIERPYARMALGAASLPAEVALAFAATGPEFG